MRAPFCQRETYLPHPSQTRSTSSLTSFVS
jgi:hypothetical protein